MDSMLFAIKKFLGGLLMPLPMTFFLLFWALILLLRQKTRWGGFLFLVAAIVLLFASSYSPLSTRVTAPLEQQFAAYQPGETSVEYISVLGSGHVTASNQPITSELNAAAVVRLAEGIRIYWLNPGSTLIFTGYRGNPDNQTTFPEKLKELAVGLGVPKEDILIFDGPKDTKDEAMLIAENFAETSLVLVTSAAHMPRAMGLFRTAGLNPIPAPTNHLVRPVRSKWSFPNAQTLMQTRNWLHEQLGFWWAKLMGQIKDEE